jgi:MFS family permease
MFQSSRIHFTCNRLSRNEIRERLPANVAMLGLVSLLTAMSSAMVYGLLPLFLMKVLGTSAAVVGIIEGAAEGTTSLLKLASGAISDWAGRRKPLVVVGYTLSAVNKLLFPVADAISTIILARVVDRIGKGIRDAPRDAFLTDVLPSGLRGSGFGLRLTFYTAGFVLGPLAAIGLMLLSGNDFRLVFWVAVIPAFLAIIVLLVAVKETPNHSADGVVRSPFRFKDLTSFSTSFWWSIAIASSLSLSRCSQAFLVLKANHVGIDAAFVPLILVLSHAVYSATAYPFGVLADRLDRCLQLGLGIAILLVAHVVLATAATIELTAVGAAFWGLQLAVTQGLLAASVADAAPDDRRGTAFAIFDLATGAATFMASAAAGALWVIGAPGLTFAAGACMAVGAMILLLLRPAATFLKPSEQ